jgi:hypothetical protein
VVVVVVHGLWFLLFDIVGMSVFVVEILCPTLVDGWFQVVIVFGVRPRAVGRAYFWLNCESTCDCMSVVGAIVSFQPCPTKLTDAAPSLRAVNRDRCFVQGCVGAGPSCRNQFPAFSCRIDRRYHICIGRSKLLLSLLWLSHERPSSANVCTA